MDYCKHGNTHIKKGDVVVDLGGNIGIFNRWAGSKGASKIISFEPDRRYFELLKLNCHENSIIFNAAISNQVGKITLNESEHLGGSFIGKRDNGDFKTYEVNTYNLNFLFDTKLVEKIDYLKIDIEGAELLALEGISDENLQKVDKIVIEYHHAEFNFDESKRDAVLERISKNGFNTFLLFMGHDNKLQMIYFWR